MAVVPAARAASAAAAHRVPQQPPSPSPLGGAGLPLGAGQRGELGRLGGSRQQSPFHVNARIRRAVKARGHT